MSWTSPDECSGNAGIVRVTASDAENSVKGHCEMHLSLKVRPKVWPSESAARRSPYRGPLFQVADVIESAHRFEAAGIDRDVAIERAKLRLNNAHPGDRVYAEHALEQYFEYHDAREAELGQLVYLGNWTVVPWRNAELGVWAPIYETADGIREVRRFRVDRAKRQDTEWADIAGLVAKQVQGSRQAIAIHVVELGLMDGLEHFVANGEDRDEVDRRFASRGRVAANAAVMGMTRTPGWDCESCKIYATCDALIPAPGALQQAEPGAWTRSVSAKDLDKYEVCPAQSHMLDEHLPSDREGSEAQARGIAVHAWLKEAHKRRIPCHLEDLADPEAPHLGLAEGLIDRSDYRVAYPYLRNHVESCALAGVDTNVVVVEETQYCLDGASDVIVAVKPDLIFTQGNTLVVHEVKTSNQPQLPDDADSARDRYLAVAMNLVVMEAGLVERFGYDRGEVHLEIITPTESRTYRYELTDEILMIMARERIRTATTSWLQDTIWPTRPGPHCSWCPVRRWCPDRDVHAAAADGNLEQKLEDGTPPF